MARMAAEPISIDSHSIMQRVIPVIARFGPCCGPIRQLPSRAQYTIVTRYAGCKTRPNVTHVSIMSSGQRSFMLLVLSSGNPKLSRSDTSRTHSIASTAFKGFGSKRRASLRLALNVASLLLHHWSGFAGTFLHTLADAVRFP